MALVVERGALFDGDQEAIPSSKCFHENHFCEH